MSLLVCEPYNEPVRTIVLEPASAEFEALLQRRQALGQDLYDEVWEGEYHMAPMARPSHGYVSRQLAVLLDPLVRQAGLVATDPFNLGSPNDYRVPDGGVHRGLPATIFVPTAAIVVEVVSPGDETWQKLDFYAAHSADELLIADPADRSITWLVLHAGRYVEAEYSPLLGITAAKLAEQIDWPATD
jgi:Uma2 family endonuclease